MPQLSYSRGPHLALRDETIFEALAEMAARHPAGEALVVRHQNARLSYRELKDRVDETARGLVGLGLKPGDRIGVWASSCVEWVLLFLACARTGIVQVNVNPAYRSQDLGFVLRKSRIKALFLHCQDARADYRQILEETIAGRQLPLEHAVYLDEHSWTSMLADGVDVPATEIKPHDVCNIQYTSGTTGSPKGVLLTHHNILNNGWIFAKWMQLSPQDRCCNCFPLYHTAGCVLGILTCLTSGATLILPASQFDAGKTLEAVEAERATALLGSPTMFIAQLGHPEFKRFDLTSLRTGGMGGAPCPIEVMKRVVEEMHCPDMMVIYGQTESSPLISMSRSDDSLERRVETIGHAISSIEVKIISPATGETVPVGMQGELCTRGYHVMKGYDEEPEATRKTIDAEGWLHTGDLATMRPDGYLGITGRAKDMIIRGGENIYPREVEEFLYSHPKVMDVQVVGLPNARWGEVVVAWIRLKAGQTCTEKEIQNFCEGKIAYFKIPEHVRFVDAFPMTVSGKVQKFIIRDREIRERGLEEVARIRTA
ncbi:MAG TPA: AMP-binding protein [Candidatus Sulfotelmatobacter sp.]|nr:AMP-binding protein [Candidatus Sulfotelmatobacter sp.]